MALSLTRATKSPTKLGGEERATVDYLCGVISDPAGEPVEGQEAIACLYEYARESRVLCGMAAEHRKRKDDEPRTLQELDNVEWPSVSARLQPFEFAWLWTRLGDYFPERPWRDVPLELRWSCLREIRPLPVLSASNFVTYASAARAAFERWKKEEVPSGQPRSESPVAIFPDENLRDGVVAAFHIDFARGKASLLDQFREWLDQMDKNGRLRKAGQKQSKDAKRWHDWLWDLAVWRLLNKICEGDLKKLQGWLEANTDEFGEEDDDKLLHREPSSWKREASRMRDHLELLLPFERTRPDGGDQDRADFDWHRRAHEFDRELMDELDTDQVLEPRKPGVYQGRDRLEREFADYFRSILEG